MYFLFLVLVPVVAFTPRFSASVSEQFFSPTLFNRAPRKMAPLFRTAGLVVCGVALVQICQFKFSAALVDDEPSNDAGFLRKLVGTPQEDVMYLAAEFIEDQEDGDEKAPTDNSSTPRRLQAEDMLLLEESSDGNGDEGSLEHPAADLAGSETNDSDDIATRRLSALEGAEAEASNEEIEENLSEASDEENDG